MGRNLQALTAIFWRGLTTLGVLNVHGSHRPVKDTSCSLSDQRRAELEHPTNH